MLTKEKALELTEKYLSEKVEVFKKGFFVLESTSEKSRWKPEGSDIWIPSLYSFTLVEFYKEIEAAYPKPNRITVDVDPINEKIVDVHIDHIEPSGEKPSRELIEKMEQAKKVLLNFLKKELELREMKLLNDIPMPISIKSHYAHNKVFLFKNDFGQFHVDLEKPVVTDFWFFSASNIEANLSLSSLDIAKKFLSEHYSKFKERNFETTCLELDEVELKESPRNEEVSIFKNRISLKVNIEKQIVTEYHCSDLWFRRREPTKISKENAIRIFNSVYPGAKDIQIDLFEELLDNKKQTVTVWYVYDSNYQQKSADHYSFGAYLEIDADNGNIIKKGVFEC